MKKKNKKKSVKKTETQGFALSPFAITGGESCTCNLTHCATDTFEFKKTKGFKDIILDVLTAGACFFFISNLYEIVVDSLNVRVHPFIECTIFGYAVYSIVKLLRD